MVERRTALSCLLAACLLSAACAGGGAGEPEPTATTRAASPPAATTAATAPPPPAASTTTQTPGARAASTTTSPSPAPTETSPRPAPTVEEAPPPEGGSEDTGPENRTKEQDEEQNKEQGGEPGEKQDGDVAVDGFVSVSAGWDYTCGVRASGSVDCWGWGRPHDPRGRSDKAFSDAWSGAADAGDPPDGAFTTVSAGWEYACGLRPGGELECWGRNRPAYKGTPGGEFKSVSAGLEHTCGARPGDRVECWGYSSRRSGAGLPPGGEFTDIVVGLDYACGLRPTGLVECWGGAYNEAWKGGWYRVRNLGWVARPPGGEFTSIFSTGWNVVCGLRPAGEAECWTDFQMLDLEEGETPAYEPPPGEFEFILPGRISYNNMGYFCGLRPGGRPECWGKGRYNKEPGPTPEAEFTSLTFTSSGVCGILVEGGSACWNIDGNGELIITSDKDIIQLTFGYNYSCRGGDTSCSSVGGIIQLTFGYNYSCRLLASGEIECPTQQVQEQDDQGNWVDVDVNEYGQASPPEGEFVALDNSGFFSCGIRVGGALECWGLDTWGQASPPEGEFVDLAVGGGFSCGLRTTGEAECWGGHANTSKILPPEEELTTVSAGWGGNQTARRFMPDKSDFGHSCGLRPDDSVRCWGGQGLLKNFEPAGEFSSVGAGDGFACGLRPTGEVECWKFGYAIDAETEELTPAWLKTTRRGDTPPGEAFTTLTVGARHYCGLRGDGDVECLNEIGANATEAEPADTTDAEPYTVPGPYTSVSAGYEHSCAVHQNGDIHCWDENGFINQITPAATPATPAPPPPSASTKTQAPGSRAASTTASPLTTWQPESAATAAAAAIAESERTTPGFVSVSAGWGYSCGLHNDGRVECWRWRDGSEPRDWEIEQGGWSVYPEVGRQPQGSFASVSAGREYACGLRPDGQAECWGPNPAALNPPHGEFSAVSAGIEHACAIRRADGKAECWGTSGRRRGAANPPLGEFTAITTGADSACGLRPDGQAECWGRRFEGASLQGPFTSPPMVVLLRTLLRTRRLRFEGASPQGPFTAVSAGAGADFCGLRPDRTVECWGERTNTGGLLAPPAGEFAAISVGMEGYACGLRPDGQAECWDSGDGTVRYQPPEHEFASLAAGAALACGAPAGGGVVCWGIADPGEPLRFGDGEFTQIVVGLYHICGLRSDGTPECWGGGEYGEGSPPDGKLTAISAGWASTCGLRPDQTAVCWGDDGYGQSSPPKGAFSSISASKYFTCGLRPDGRAECWGGEGTQSRLQSKIVPINEPLASVSAGWGGNQEVYTGIDNYPEVVHDWGYSCGLLTNGAAECWGDDPWNDPKTAQSLTRRPEGAFTRIAAGRYNACGLRPTGVIECWGSSPVAASRGGSSDYYAASGTYEAAGGGYTDLSVGGRFTCGLRAGGAVDCWGDDGSSTHLRAGPYTQVSAGYEHQCGLLASRQIECWEHQEPGQPPLVRRYGAAAR